MKIISGILILVTAFLSIKHGWAGLSGNFTPEEANMMSSLGVNKPLGYVISIGLTQKVPHPNPSP